MNKSLLICLLIGFISVFFVGLYIGTFENFSSNSLDMIINNSDSSDKTELNPVISKFNSNTIVQIQNESDIKKIRDELIFYIWNEPPSVIFPSENLSKIIPVAKKNFLDKRFENLDNIKSIEKLSIEMKHGVNSIVYIFHAEKSNNELIIYHQGHSGGFINGKSTINYFLNNGYSVMAFSMPLMGMNNQPIINVENIGTMKFFEQEQFKFLESEHFSPLNYFFTPINLSINYLDLNYNFNNYHMIGISGGGWTTTIYPALDTRISKSFAVSGSIPIPLRINPQDIGDYEQLIPDFYNIANYLELYVMSSYGPNREFVQIFNKFDPCCFSGTLFENYQEKLQNKLSELNNGRFNVILDDTHNEHKISEHALELILKKIQ